MKLPPFDYTKADWDAWRAFYVVHHSYNNFVQFDTGEFVVCCHRWRPDERRVYPGLGLAIVGTDDERCPRLFVPGSASTSAEGAGAKPIFKTHLNHKGQQVLLLDLTHHRAVCVDGWLTREKYPLVPQRFTNRMGRTVSAYYAGGEAVPVGLPIVQYHPAPLTNEERAHVTDLKEACHVWLQMQADPKALMHKHIVSASRNPLPVSEFVDVSFAALTEAHRVEIAVHGFDTIVKEEHEYLTFTTGEKVDR